MLAVAVALVVWIRAVLVLRLLAALGVAAIAVNLRNRAGPELLILAAVAVLVATISQLIQRTLVALVVLVS